MGTLTNKTIITTRPAQKEDLLKDLLTDMGANVIEFPMIKTICNPLNDDIISSIKKLHHFNWVIFTSKNGISCFSKVLKQFGISKDVLDSKQIAVMGKATAGVLMEQFSIEPALENCRSSADILEKLKLVVSKNDHVLLVLGELADKQLEEGLKELTQVHRVNVYRTESLSYDDHPAFQKLKSGDFDLILFTSPSGCRSFNKIALKLGLTDYKAACIGQTTASELEIAGQTVRLIAADPEAENFAKEIESLLIH